MIDIQILGLLFLDEGLLVKLLGHRNRIKRVQTEQDES